MLVIDVYEETSTKESRWAVASTVVNYLSLKNDKGKTPSTGTEYIGHRHSSAAKYAKKGFKSGKEALRGSIYAGVINAFRGGIDYSGGATHWDGFDFAARGFNHSKFGRGAVLQAKHLRAYGDAWTDDDIRITSGGSYSTKAELFTNTWHRKAGATRLGTSRYNVNKLTYMSSAVYGRTIFWKTININVGSMINDNIIKSS